MDKKKFLLRDFSYSKNFAKWVEKLTFSRILFLWSLTILAFGFIYSYLATNSSYLLRAENNSVVTNLADAIYFSFISSTTTGYGDIVPMGNFRLIAIFEIVIGMILLAFVTSRLVSIKQNVILNEIYEISLSDNVNRLRLSLTVFVQKINSYVAEAQNEGLSSKTLQDVEFSFLQYEDIIKDMIIVSGIEKNDSAFRKSLNILDTELLVFNLINSLERINILFSVINTKRKSKKGFIHVRKTMKRSLPRLEKFLDSFQKLDVDIDFDNFISRKEFALTQMKKYLDLDEKEK